MEEFTYQNNNDIEKAWKAILDNTIVLDEKTRSKIYTRLQSIKYYTIDASEAAQFGASVGAVAFYLSETNSVYLINGKPRTQKSIIILHELLHGISCGTEFDGFYCGYQTRSQDFSQIYFKHNAFNEGVTEFLTCKYLNTEDTATAYFDFVNIVSYLADKIGYENLMTKYYNNDVKGLKENIRETFHLADYYLIDKLFFYMDKRMDEIESVDLIYDSPFARRCQELLLEMEMNKVLFEHKNEIKDNNDVFKFIDVEEFYKKLNSGVASEYNDSFVYSRSVMLDDFLKTGSYENKSKELFDYMLKYYSKRFDDLKKLSPKEIVMASDLFNKSLTYTFREQTLTDDSLKNVLKSLLEIFADQNGKIDLSKFSVSQKFDFMNNILYNRKELETYKFFYPKDLVWYTNHNDMSRYTKFNNIEFVNYIYDYYDNLKGRKPQAFDANYKLVSQLKAQENKKDEEKQKLEF